MAVSAAFALSGVALASWLARVPEVRELLALTSGQLGLLLLALSLGAIAALPLSGAVVRVLRPAGAVAAGALCVSAGLVVAGLGAGVLAEPLVAAAGLLLVGAGTGVWDVAMNVEGAAVERRLARTVMPRYHAAFSLGTVAGAGAGALAVATVFPVVWHLVGAAALVVVGVLTAVRRFLRAVPVSEDGGQPSPAAPAAVGGAWRAWREPRTLAVGLVVLCAAFVEGVANDWLAIGVHDGYGSPRAVGVLVFAVFLAAMTTGRLLAGPLMDRLGRARVVGSSFLLVVVGVAVVVLGPAVWSAFAGAALWGLGSAVGFPAGMSAAAEAGDAEARVAVAATIGYAAFLAGPPLLGFLGDAVGVHHALAVVAVVAVGGAALARVVAPPAPGART